MVHIIHTHRGIAGLHVRIRLKRFLYTKNNDVRSITYIIKMAG